MLRSLRARLLVGMTASISVLLILFGVVIYATIRQSLLEEFDFGLEKMVRTLAAGGVGRTWCDRSGIGAGADP